MQKKSYLLLAVLIVMGFYVAFGVENPAEIYDVFANVVKKLAEWGESVFGSWSDFTSDPYGFVEGLFTSVFDKINTAVFDKIAVFFEDLFSGLKISLKDLFA